ncbi:hypothetical protein [Microbacterium dextranolyticum]|uniref:Integral membrane protein n=1 Tax=Microbacterium dextranolyticum TaxID=36806 RepID=A0A9W6HN81_9MICO|nr:hypothetical protein [Microbacterium dextranolyticum]MBM7463287.1 hypothetical protein [Microbacterium dextranolyticum]GLJ95608.1 hypothetical protein GCM10017591_16710 [Microbacterium dextranolyticum]
MADGSVIERSAKDVLTRLSLRPAASVAIIYIGARLVTTLFLFIAATMAHARTGGDETIGSLSMRWDGQWYWVVGVQGYPTELPRNHDGEVTQNAWAFMPLYPFLSRVLSFALGNQYPIAAVVLAIVAGYLSCLVLYHLLRERIDATSSLWAVALFAAGPLAALFQMGYAESLFLLWLFLALLMLVRRRFAWLYLLIPLMGFTRPGALAFALMLGLYGIMRWMRRRADALPVIQIVHIVALGLLSTAVGFAWQVIAGIATKDSSAYLETELAWRRDWTGSEGGFEPFTGFVQATAIWFRVWGPPEVLGYVTLVAVVLAVAAILLFEPHVRRLGPEIRLWSASYAFYLLLVFFPQSSIFRLLLPLAPLYGALALPRSRAWRMGALIVGVALQWWWIYQMLALGTTFAQIP